MNPGKLNRRIVIQQRDGTKRPGGQLNDNWVELTKVWAQILTLTGKEFATSNSQVSGVTASLRLRYRTDITSDMRALHGTVVYEILAVLPDETDRRFMFLAVRTGVNNG